MMALLGGLALGLASSAHCAAMCGPLVAAVGARLAAPGRAAQIRHALLYHAGRTAIYVALALPAGVAGELLVVRGFGRALAICAGAALLVGAAAAARLAVVSRLTAPVSRAIVRASSSAVQWAARRPIAGPIATGAVNGMLPCGLVYAALATAGAAGSLRGAMLVMTGFGAGTAAILVVMALGIASVPAAMRLRLRPLGPLVLAITAVILLARGVAAPHRHPAAGTIAVHHVHHE